MRNPFQAMIQNQIAGMQTQLVTAMQELADLEIEGSSGGGVVKISLTGAGEVRRVCIDPEVLQEQDAELVGDLVCAALRDALGKVSQAKHEKIVQASPLAGLGVDLPNIF